MFLGILVSQPIHSYSSTSNNDQVYIGPFCDEIIDHLSHRLTILHYKYLEILYNPIQISKLILEFEDKIGRS